MQANCCCIGLPPAASLLHLGESKQNQIKDMNQFREGEYDFQVPSER